VASLDVRDTSLRLLDGFELRYHDVPLTLAKGSQRILAFLALADREVERGSAAYQLWPDKTEDRAVANLRSALWRIRQQPAALVVTNATRVRLHPDVWVDARDGVRELQSFPLDAVLSDDTTMTLRGELLPDWYDEWLLTERERLRQVRLHALEDTARQLVATGAFARAIDVGLRAIAMEPLRESAHELVIAAHLAEGNPYEAHRQYERLVVLLRDELGVEPSRRLRDLVSMRNQARDGASTAIAST
jgi:DNA-binding SARP family transcriptional activator